MIEKYSEPWMTGFVEELANLGCDEATAAALVKETANSELSKNAAFQEGYTKEMERLVKESAAATIPGSIVDALVRGGGKVLSRPAVLLPTTAATLLGGHALYKNLLEPYWGRGTFDNDLNQISDAYRKGLISDTTFASSIRELTRQRAAALRRAAGGSSYDSLYERMYGGY